MLFFSILVDFTSNINTEVLRFYWLSFMFKMQEKWKYFSAKMSQPPPQISEVPNVQYQLQPILVKVRTK